MLSASETGDQHRLNFRLTVSKDTTLFAGIKLRTIIFKPRTDQNTHVINRHKNKHNQVFPSLTSAALWSNDMTADLQSRAHRFYLCLGYYCVGQYASVIYSVISVTAGKTAICLLFIAVSDSS